MTLKVELTEEQVKALAAWATALESGLPPSLETEPIDDATESAAFDVASEVRDKLLEYERGAEARRLRQIVARLFQMYKSVTDETLVHGTLEACHLSENELMDAPPVHILELPGNTVRVVLATTARVSVSQEMAAEMADV